VLASLIYSFAMLDYQNPSWYSWGMTFFHGAICGWVWRHTSKVTVSALASSIIVWIGVGVLAFGPGK